MLISSAIELEALLILTGAVIPTDKPIPNRNRDRDEDEVDEDYGARRAKPAPRNVRGKTTVEDDDSDFDM